MPGVTRLELATSGVTDRQTQKLGKFNTSFYAHKQRLKQGRSRHESTVGFRSGPISGPIVTLHLATPCTIASVRGRCHRSSLAETGPDRAAVWCWLVNSTARCRTYPER